MFGPIKGMKKRRWRREMNKKVKKKKNGSRVAATAASFKA